MIGVTTYKIQKNAFFFGILPDMLENFSSDIVAEERFPVFCRPDEMYPNFDKWHKAKIFG